jgi:hypothetical protein
MEFSREGTLHPVKPMNAVDHDAEFDAKMQEIVKYVMIIGGSCIFALVGFILAVWYAASPRNANRCAATATWPSAFLVPSFSLQIVLTPDPRALSLSPCSPPL